MTSAIGQTTTARFDQGPKSDQQTPRKVDTPTFSRSNTATDQAQAPRDGVMRYFRSNVKYQPLIDQDVLAMNRKQIQELAKDLWGSALRGKSIPPIPLSAHVFVDGKSHQISMSKIGDKIVFHAPSLTKGGADDDTSVLCILEENRAPRYFNGMKSDDAVITLMIMSARDNLQRNPPHA